MNWSLTLLEVLVVALGLGVLLADLWMTGTARRALGWAAIGGLGLIFLYSFTLSGAEPKYAFEQMYVQDAFSLFFKRFFLVVGVFVLLMAMEFRSRFPVGLSEFHSVSLFALAGMMLASSANDLVLLFVALELMTVSFYVLVSFQRGKVRSLEAGVKYLILGALSAAFLIYGIALVYGTAGSTQFQTIAANGEALAQKPIFLVGVLLILVGLGFKIAAFPFHVWAPDVYEGAPAPVTAFLAVGSKAAGFVLLLRLCFTAFPDVGHWEKLWLLMACISILYGNLCALPQRNLKRLLGYSSIANAGYLLLGVAVMRASGAEAVLFFLCGYLFTVVTAFLTIVLVLPAGAEEDVSEVAGLYNRSPLTGTALALAMISLAGVPPLAGFFGKFLLLKAVLEEGTQYTPYLIALGVAVVGVVISFYYYFGVIKAIFWGKPYQDVGPLVLSFPAKAGLILGISGMLFLGIFPGPAMNWASAAVKVFALP